MHGAPSENAVFRSRFGNLGDSPSLKLRSRSIISKPHWNRNASSVQQTETLRVGAVGDVAGTGRTGVRRLRVDLLYRLRLGTSYRGVVARVREIVRRPE